MLRPGGEMPHKKQLIRNSTAEFLIFTGKAGEQSIEARYEDETIWLSQKLMATLFDVGVNTINYHLKEVYESGEIKPEATIRKFRIVQQEGSRQVAREVKTKFSKTFTTFYFPVGEEVCGIVSEWVSYLRDEKLWGNDDPLFPATRVEPGPDKEFVATGLSREHWSSATPIRKIFREAFLSAGLPYFNPHSFRNTLVQLGREICKTPEQFKAWSQNLGHEKELTTFLSYGEVPCQRQGEIILDLAAPQRALPTDVDEIAEAVYKKLLSSGVDVQGIEKTGI